MEKLLREVFVFVLGGKQECYSISAKAHVHASPYDLRHPVCVLSIGLPPPNRHDRRRPHRRPLGVCYRLRSRRNYLDRFVQG